MQTKKMWNQFVRHGCPTLRGIIRTQNVPGLIWNKLPEICKRVRNRLVNQRGSNKKERDKGMIIGNR